MRRNLPLFVLLLAAASTLLARPAVASEIYFPHEVHVQENGLECDACHAAVVDSKSVTDDLLPTMDTCGDCHDVESDSECGTCHRGSGEPAGYSADKIAVDFFSHAEHLGQGLECETCHEGTGSAPMRAAAMNDCRSCHVTQSALADCQQCHVDGEEFAPPSHGAGWESWHGVESRAADNGCESCHTQSDCQACHNGDNVRPRTHPTGFEFRHALDAQISAIECETCHADRSFCSSCHQSRGVRPSNHNDAFWSPYPGGGQHALEAKLDLESCLICHEGESGPSCARCHH